MAQFELAALAVRTLGDHPPPHPDALYIFSELPDNQASPVLAAASALARWPSLRILITNEDGTRVPGVSGEAIRELLLSAGVPGSSIEFVPFDPSAPLIHTLNEAEFLIQHAGTKGYTRVLIAAPPFHLLRAFVTTCSVAMRATGGELKVYAFQGESQPWDEEVVHSQGTVTGSRSVLLNGELERIERYTAKGDIACCSKLLEYLDRRDASDRNC